MILTSVQILKFHVIFTKPGNEKHRTTAPRLQHGFWWKVYPNLFSYICPHESTPETFFFINGSDAHHWQCCSSHQNRHSVSVSYFLTDFMETRSITNTPVVISVLQRQHLKQLTRYSNPHGYPKELGMCTNEILLKRGELVLIIAGHKSSFQSTI